jgi:HECT-domain (ubiquitin-transferase)
VVDSFPLSLSLSLSLSSDFWDVVHNDLTDGERKRLLFFSTGSDRSPIGGLGNLKFYIAKQGGELDQFVPLCCCVCLSVRMFVCVALMLHSSRSRSLSNSGTL